jgi:hypothetical protein
MVSKSDTNLGKSPTCPALKSGREETGADPGLRNIEGGTYLHSAHPLRKKESPLHNTASCRPAHMAATSARAGHGLGVCLVEPTRPSQLVEGLRSLPSPTNQSSSPDAPADAADDRQSPTSAAAPDRPSSPSSPSSASSVTHDNELLALVLVPTAIECDVFRDELPCRPIRSYLRRLDTHISAEERARPSRRLSYLRRLDTHSAEERAVQFEGRRRMPAKW